MVNEGKPGDLPEWVYAWLEEEKTSQYFQGVKVKKEPQSGEEVTTTAEQF